MSEEEIIKNINEQIQWSDHNTYKIALQGILDLYNKEKEKNASLQKEIEELKKDNIHQWEERCRLTFELQETEDRLSKIELQLLEEE